MGPDGKPVVFDPTGAGSQTINADVPLAIYVSRRRRSSARNFGMMAVMPFANGALEAPGLGLAEKASTGAERPVRHAGAARMALQARDAIAGVAFFAPTGRHSAGASDNLGKGMWSYEVSGGGTVYLDRQRSVSASRRPRTGRRTRRRKAQVADRGARHRASDVKVGQLLTLEGGVGKSFLHGAAGVGVAYYAQWKITDDHDARCRPEHR